MFGQKENRMNDLRIIILTIKYWFQGDTLQEANEYARAIVTGFKQYGRMQ